MASKTNFSVVIDIGTSNLAAIAGQKNEDGKLEIIGMARVTARGIKRGMVLNIEEAAAAVGQLLGELQLQTGKPVSKVDIAYAGQPMKILEHKGYRLTTGDGLVSQADVDELWGEVENLQTEEGCKILHIIPQQYTVDEEITDLIPVKKLKLLIKLLWFRRFTSRISDGFLIKTGWKSMKLFLPHWLLQRLF